MKKLTDSVAEFLTDNIQLIDDFDFDTLYAQASSKLKFGDIAKLTETLLGVGIDPIPHMTNIPAGFMLESRYTGQITIGSNIEFIAHSAFMKSNITELVIDGVQEIGDHTFQGCSRLHKIILTGEINHIGYAAFADTPVESIELPTTVKMLGPESFARCTALQTVVLSECLTNIPSRCFQRCKSLKRIYIPEGVTIISSEAFDSCSSLTNVGLPSTLQIIGNNAFSWTGITSIDIPEGTVKLVSGCFMGCDKLTRVVLPASIKECHTDILYQTDEKRLTVYCYPDSAGAEFAQKHKFKIKYM